MPERAPRAGTQTRAIRPRRRAPGVTSTPAVPCSRLLLALLVILALLTVGPLANADADDAAPGWQGADLDGVEHNASGMACEGVRISIPEPTPGSLLVLPERPYPVGGPTAMPTGPRAPPVRSSTLTRIVHTQILRAERKVCAVQHPHQMFPSRNRSRNTRDCPGLTPSEWHHACVSGGPRVTDEIVSSSSGFVGPRALEDAGQRALALSRVSVIWVAGPFAYPVGAVSLAQRSSGSGSPGVAQCRPSAPAREAE
jgi:hypothetical protein